MEKDNNIFDDLLKSQLADLSGDVSMNDWDAIASRLDAMEEKKRRVVPMWWIWSTGIVLTALVVGWFAFNNNNEKVTTLDNPTQVENEVVQAPVTPENDSEIKNKYIPTEVLTPAEANQPNQPEITPSRKNTPQPAVNTVGAANTGSSTPDFAGTIDKADNLTQSDDQGNMSVATTNGENVEDKTDKPTTVLNELPQTIEVDKLPTKNKVDNKLGDSTSKGGRIPSFTTAFPHENYGGWELGFSATPNLAGKFIGENGSQAWRINNKYLNIADKMESSAASYRIDARVNKYFGHNFYIGAGLAYNQVEEDVSYDYVIDRWYVVRETEKTIEEGPQYINPAQWEHVNYNGTNKYHFIELPVRMGYILPIAQNRFNLRFETGFKYMYLAGMQGMKADVSVLELVDLATVTTYNRNNFGLIGRAGIHYYLNENLDLGLIPYFGTSLTSIRAKNDGITDRPYNSGFNISLQYKFSTP